MNKKYSSIEEFMMDLDFRQWVLDPQPESDLYWKTWMKNNPWLIKELLLAKELILKLEFHTRNPDQEKYDGILQNVLAGDYSPNAKGTLLRQSSRFGIKQYLKIAALLVLVGSLALAYYSFEVNSTEHFTTNSKVIVKENPSGRKSQVFLPDGSVVWLNAESRIEYEVSHKDQSRIVKLTGEAFFDVAKDKSRPFIVKTSECSVTAIGTQFNVKAYPNENTYKISLSEGIVRVQVKNEATNEGTILSPGEALSMDFESGLKLKINFNPKEAMGWKTGILYFEDASFSEVVSKLQRWYGMQFVVEGAPKGGIWNFSSEFHDETLENVLRTISYAKHFEYKIEDKTVKLIF